ncbi:MAG: glycosyltransferase [Prolixibacteraceae bacterium]|nr:glycosyltransferase [Prolixibacteraceae bacterium]
MNTSQQVNSGAMPLISIVVPIFKVEMYLKRCIESILNQTYANLELILVDDGSPDNCGQICDFYAERDNRIKVIHKPNGGLSDARNAGINIANGDFIGFVDSDDFVHPDMFQSLYNLIEKHGADVAQCSFQRVVDDELKDPGSDNQIKVLTNVDALDMMYTSFRVDYVVAWNKLYRKQLFDEIRYPKSKIHEDEFTTYKLLFLAEKVVVTNKKYYYYFQSPNSIIRSTFSEKKLHYAEAMESRIAFFEEKQLERFYTKTILGYAQWLLLFTYRNRQELKKLPETKSYLTERYAKIKTRINVDSGISKRSKFAFELAENCPNMAGFLIFQQQYKNNVVGKLAILIGLIDE